MKKQEEKEKNFAPLWQEKKKGREQAPIEKAEGVNRTSHRFVKVLALLLFMGILLSGGLYVLLSKDRTFSPSENRYLSQRPVLSVSSVLSGRFQDELEDYISDQFPLRDDLMAVAVNTAYLSGQRTIGDVMVGNGRQLFERKTDEEMKASRFDANLSQIFQMVKRQQERNPKVMIVPSPASCMMRALPEGADNYDEKPYFDQLSEALGEAFVDCRPELLAACAKDEYVYYRTDHHWTSYGAYLGYLAYAKETGLPVSYASFAAAGKAYGLSKVSDSFLGTLQSKVCGLSVEADEIWRMDIPEAFVEIEGRKGQVFYEEKLSEKDQYTYFFGGNYGKMKIVVKEPSEKAAGKRLMVVKDSFANCFVEYLLPYYEEIYLVDMRYFNGSFDLLLAGENITDILVLYEMTHLAEDTNMLKLNL